MCVLSLCDQLCLTLCDPPPHTHTIAHQFPLRMGFPSHNTEVGCYFLLQWTFPPSLPNPGIKPMTPALRSGFFTTAPPGCVFALLPYIKHSSLYHAIRSLFFQFSSVTQSYLTLCDPMNHSMPGLPVHHQLSESIQTLAHWVSDAIQPSHPLPSPSLPALNLSQNQGLFKWVSSLHQVAKIIGVSASTSVLPMNTQDWSPFRWTGWISLQSKGLSRGFSNTTVQKHKFFSA